MVSVAVALSLKIATATTSREISLVNDYEDVTTRYVLEQLLILAGNDQSDFSESPLRRLTAPEKLGIRNEELGMKVAAHKLESAAL